MYAPVNGLQMYHEVHGTGRPLVLLPGGHQTIGLGFAALLPRLAAGRQVIAVEQQGHGRTGDIDRTPTIANLGADLVGLLDHLGLERADVLGFSLGGLAAMEAAIRHPDRVDRLVFAAGEVRPDGIHTEITDPSLWATSTRMPTADDFAAMRTEHERLAPGPDLDAQMAKQGPVVHGFGGWSDEELAGVRAETLIMIGDHDFVTVEHAALELSLIPGSRLSVIPGTTHTRLMHRVDLIAPVLEDFLAR